MPNNRVLLPKILWGSGATVDSPTNFHAAGNGVPGSGAFTNGQTYYFVITAIVGGVESARSAESGTLISVANDSIAFTWNAVPGATGYRIYIGTAAGAEDRYRPLGAVTAYNDTTNTGYTLAAPAGFTAAGNGVAGSGFFASGQSYYFVVTAIVSGVESARSSEVGVFITAANDSVTFGWTAIAGATAYRIYKGLVAGAEDRYRQVGAVTSYTDNTATAYTLGAPPGTNTLNVGYLLDNIKAGDQPRAGSAFDQTPSGVEDAWITGFDYTLACELRWIPQTNTASPLATGWDGVTGVRAWLQWARQKNPMRFYPDASAAAYIPCYLQDPMQGYPDVEENGQRRLAIVLRQSSVPFDGY